MNRCELEMETGGGGGEARPAAGEALTKVDAALVALLFLAALSLRLFLLPSHDVISTDGTSYVGTAREIATGNWNGVSFFGFYPVLVWLASLAGGDTELSGQLLSVMAGSLLVVPLYLLGKSLFSRRTALVATVLAVAWPSLVGWSCEVMTQAPYLLLTVTGSYLLLRATWRPTLGTGVAAGFCLALAYLTRPEGLLLIFSLPAALLVWKRRDLVTLRRALAGYCCVVLLLFLGNLLFIHGVTGIWQVSAKTGSALNDSLVINHRIPGLSVLPPGKSYGYLDILREYPDFIWTTGWSNLKKLPEDWLPVPLLLLALVGLVRGGRGKELFLLASCAPLAVLIAFYYVSPEYTQPYLPPLFLLVGEGGAVLEGIICRGRERWRRIPLAPAAALVFAVSIAVAQIPSGRNHPYTPYSDDGRRDFKNIGLLLKKYLPPGKLMTPWARIAYYAQRERVTIPNVYSLQQILQTARANHVRFLVVDGKIRRHPGLGFLLDPVSPGAQPEHVFLLTPEEQVLGVTGLRPLLLYRDPSSFGVAVYELTL